MTVRQLCVVELAMLSELKIASLEGQKKEAKQGYQEQLQAYVTSYLGQPLEKVHVSECSVRTIDEMIDNVLSGYGIVGFNVPRDTLYRSFWDGFMGQMTQPTVS